jgi:bacterioferritin (cytochrome b1)
VIKLTAVVIEEHRCYQHHTKFFPVYPSQNVKSICKRNYGEKKMQHNETVRQLLTDFREVFDSVSRETFYSILIQFEEPIELVRLTIKYCLV